VSGVRSVTVTHGDGETFIPSSRLWGINAEEIGPMLIYFNVKDELYRRFGEIFLEVDEETEQKIQRFFSHNVDEPVVNTVDDAYATGDICFVFSQPELGTVLYIPSLGFVIESEEGMQTIPSWYAESVPPSTRSQLTPILDRFDSARYEESTAAFTRDRNRSQPQHTPVILNWFEDLMDRTGYER
jgi:hypothetical protein